MTTTVAPAPAHKVHPARQKAIQPFLDKLRSWCGSPAGSSDLDRPAKITIGRQQLVMESWEREQLQRFFQGPRDSLPGLVAHGIALVIKSTLDVERLKQEESNQSTEVYALQAELMLNTAIGTALLHETDLATATAVQNGGVETAKSLSVFRHKLARAVSEAKKRIADSERDQAEALAGSMTDRPFPVDGVGGEAPVAAARHIEGSPDVQAAIEEAAEAVPTQLRRRRRRRSRQGIDASAGPPPQPVRIPGRTGLLALAAGVLAAIWLLAVQLPKSTNAGLTLIKRSHIGASADLTVDARPPSLFVTVPSAEWDVMSISQQDELIDSISAAASREGYAGALLTTDAGLPVARWLSLRGDERMTDLEIVPAVPR